MCDFMCPTQNEYMLGTFTKPQKANRKRLRQNNKMGIYCVSNYAQTL